MFYLTNQKGNNKTLDLYIFFLKNFITTLRSELSVICESENDYHYILSQIENDNININLFCIEKQLLETPPLSNKELKKFKEIISKKKYNYIENNYDSNDLYQLAKIIYEKLKLEINKTSKKFIIVNQGVGVFHSVPLVITQEISNILGVLIVLPFSSPLKGRLSIYESIYFQNKAVVNDYNENLNNDSLKNNLIIDYLDDYIQKENDLLIRKNRFFKKYPKFDIQKIINFKHFFQAFYYKIFYRKIFFHNKKNTKPYILVMLSKKRQWFNAYANQHLNDRKSIIKNIRKNVPSKYNIVLRSHPRDKYLDDYESMKFLISNDDVKISLYNAFRNDNYEIINNSKMVIAYGSSSIIVPLILKKNVIEIGKESLFFPMNNPPIGRIMDGDELKDKFDELFNKKVSSKKINSYLFSIYNNSYAVTHDENVKKKNPFYHFRTQKNTVELVKIILRFLKRNELI